MEDYIFTIKKKLRCVAIVNSIGVQMIEVVLRVLW